MENRKYLIVNTTELDKIDFSQVMQKSQFNIRKTNDGSKFIIKWEEIDPTFLNDLQTKQGPYTHSEILAILEQSEWITPMP